MKKKILLIIILILPILIDAKINNDYVTSSNYANKYISIYPDNKLYILRSESGLEIPYKYENNVLSSVSKFKNGGLLNLDEFRKSKDRNGNTYLYTGNNYWTMTENSSKVYIIDNSSTDNELLTDKASLSGTRVTEYVRENTGVTGIGTYNDPWMFVERFEVSVMSADTAAGEVSPKTYFANKGEDVEIRVLPNSEYNYDRNNCDAIYQNNKIIIRNVTKNISCKVYFKKQAIKITYNNNGGNGCSSKTITSGEKIGSLCTPNKSSSQFDGWYKHDGTKVDENSVFTESTTLTAKWTTKFLVKYDYSNNGGNSSNATNQEVLSGNEANLSFTASKNGYTFLGWNTNANAMAPLTSFKPIANTTLYAIYRKTLTITYKDYQGIRTNSIHIYNKATSGDITLLSERKFQDNCGGSSWNDTYTNLGWSTGTTANGQITYSNGQTIKISNNITLNGQYKKEVRAVRDGNGGTCSPN